MASLIYLPHPPSDLPTYLYIHTYHTTMPSFVFETEGEGHVRVRWVPAAPCCTPFPSPVCMKKRRGNEEEEEAWERERKRIMWVCG